MGKHIVVHGFVKNYTQWIFHGEAHHAREEVLRQRIKTFDAEAGCADMIEDFHQGNFNKGPDQVITTCCLPHRNHFTSTLMCLNLMPSGA
jgi:hypothetical protein